MKLGVAMDITLIQLVGLAVIAMFIAVFLKKYQPEISVLICLGLGIFLFFYLIQAFESTFLFLQSLSEMINLTYVSVLLKLIGIAYICEFASGICKDAGYQSVSGQIEMAGRVSMLLISLPVMRSIIQTISEFLNGG